VKERKGQEPIKMHPRSGQARGVGVEGTTKTGSFLVKGNMHRS